MSGVRFDKIQQLILSENVVKVTSKSIIYIENFKLKAIYVIVLWTVETKKR